MPLSMISLMFRGEAYEATIGDLIDVLEAKRTRPLSMISLMFRGEAYDVTIGDLIDVLEAKSRRLLRRYMH